MHRQLFFTFLKLSADPRRCLCCDGQGCVALMLQNFSALDVHISPSVGSLSFYCTEISCKPSVYPGHLYCILNLILFLIFPIPLTAAWVCLCAGFNNSERTCDKEFIIRRAATNRVLNVLRHWVSKHSQVPPPAHRVSISHCSCHGQPCPAALPVVNNSCVHAEIYPFIYLR